MVRKASFGLILLICLFMSGCIATQKSVEDSNITASKNADAIAKLASYIDVKFKDEVTETIKKEVVKNADEAFVNITKDTGAIKAEHVEVGKQAVTSITSMLGIPFGGVAADILASLLLLFAGKKGVDKRRKLEEDRRREQDAWEQFLAESTPDVALKAKEKFN